MNICEIMNFVTAAGVVLAWYNIRQQSKFNKKSTLENNIENVVSELHRLERTVQALELRINNLSYNAGSLRFFGRSIENYYLNTETIKVRLAIVYSAINTGNEKQLMKHLENIEMYRSKISKPFFEYRLEEFYENDEVDGKEIKISADNYAEVKAIIPEINKCISEFYQTKKVVSDEIFSKL